MKSRALKPTPDWRTAAIGNESGWTFLETLIVLGIILILTVTVGFSASRYLQKAKEVAARSQIETLSIALQSYALDNGGFPTKDQGLEALWKRPMLAPMPEKWRGPYLMKRLPMDPWGNPYRYGNPGPEGLEFAITSFGADGMPGGEGNDEDIASY